MQIWPTVNGYDMKTGMGTIPTTVMKNYNFDEFKLCL